MDLTPFPRRQVLRWELFVRVILALLIPLLIGVIANGDLVGLLAGVIAALIAISYLGPDAGLFGWSVLAAAGTALAAMGGLLIGAAHPALQLAVIFALFTALGAAMLAGLISQLAVTPVAFIGLITIVLGDGNLTPGAALLICGGAVWSLFLIAVLPRWSGWPRLPLPSQALQPDVQLLRRMVRRPQLRLWGFPLLLGALATGVLLLAWIFDDGARPYWAVLGLVGALGPVATKTRRDGWQTVGGTVLGVFAALFLFELPLADGAALTIGLLLGFLGVLVMLTHGLWSKALLTVLVVVLIAVLTSDAPGAVAGLRLVDYLLGATAALLAAGLAEYLAQRLEEDRPDEANIVG